jgi:hypothetical protein
MPRATGVQVRTTANSMAMIRTRSCRRRPVKAVCRTGARGGTRVRSVGREDRRRKGCDANSPRRVRPERAALLPQKCILSGPHGQERTIWCSAVRSARHKVKIAYEVDVRRSSPARRPTASPLLILDTDRNLLLGVLALQSDLLAPNRFAKGYPGWASRKDARLANLLVKRGWLNP